MNPSPARAFRALRALRSRHGKPASARLAARTTDRRSGPLTPRPALTGEGPYLQGRVIPPAVAVTDAAALSAIQYMLRDPDWGVGMLEDIAEIVGSTGRTVENYPDDRPTWNRH
jgi:hypothetical protein